MNPVVVASPRAAPLEPIEGAVTFAPADRLLLVAPHPDDESLAAAGLLQQAKRSGAGLRVVYVTDGENNPWAQLVFEGRWPARAADRQRWGARRRREALDALAQFGVAPEQACFLGCADQGLTDELARADERLLRALTGEIRASRPTVMAIPSLGDQHPDHSAIAIMTRIALERAAELAPAPRLLPYLVHAPARHEPGNAWVHLASAERESKRRAILCHRSQLRWRRSGLLAAVRESEDFLTLAPERPHDATHPIEQARFEGQELVFELARQPRLAFGPTVLRVLFETPHSAMVVAALPFASRRETVARLGSSRGSSCGEIRLSYDAASRRGTLRLTTRLEPRQAYLKLERPLERRAGFFDEAGWRAVQVCSGAEARPEHGRRA